MRQSYDIVGSFNNQRNTTIDAERSINVFEYLDPKGKKEKILYFTSGILNSNLNFANATGGFRAQFVFKNAMYVVVGRFVFRIDTALNVSFLGEINTISGYVGVTANTHQVIFVDGMNGWIWDDNRDVFEAITDTNFPDAPIDVDYLDGFFIVANGNTNTFFLSSFNEGFIWGGFSATFTATVATNLITVANTDNFTTGIPVTVSTTGTLPSPLSPGVTYFVIRISATTIRLATTYENAIANPAIPIVLTTAGTPTNTISKVGELQQGSITSHPGNIVALRTLHRRLFIFSEFFTEVWENAGVGTNLPLRRNNSLLCEFGCSAIGSVAVGFDRMFFLSQDRDGLGAVMEIIGSQAVPISTRALDYQLAHYASTPDIGVSDARGILIKENGLMFYRLNFTAANHTYIFNISMSDPENLRWHEEELLNGDRHPAQTHGYFTGLNFYGHYAHPILYIVDDHYVTNDSEAIHRTRIGKAVVSPTYERLRVDRFQLDLLQGEPSDLIVVSEGVPIETEDGFDLETESGDILTTESVLQDFTEDPVVFLSISKDGGRTYGNKLRGNMGKTGERTFRTVWRKLGTIPRGQAFVPKIEFYNQIPFVVLGASWDFEVLPE